jgi:hypothetical protein
VVGVVLATTATFALVAVNGPDKQAEHLIKTNSVTQPDVVRYGQR